MTTGPRWNNCVLILFVVWKCWNIYLKKVMVYQEFAVAGLDKS